MTGRHAGVPRSGLCETHESTDIAMPLNRHARVAGAHANSVVAAGLRCILKAQPGFEVAPEGLVPAPASDRAPDLLVADHVTALEWARRRADADVPAPGHILVVAMAGEEADVCHALQAGVHGYVILEGPAEEIAQGARTVAEGHRVHLARRWF